jgi:hypothetical protein
MPHSAVISIVLWLSLHWWIFSAAFSITVRGDFSSSPLAFIIELVCAATVFFDYLRTQISLDGGLAKMLKEWKILVHAIGIGAVVFVFAWIVVFLFNVISVQREMVSSPPSINMELIPQRYSIILQPGMVITEKDFFDRFQYELDITNTSDKLDIAPLDLRFQFPYTVDSSEIKSTDRDEDKVTFTPEIATTSFSGGGTLKLIGGGPVTWRNYNLHASKFSAKGRIAITVRLNGKSDPRAKSYDPRWPAILPRNQSLYVSGYISFSMGGREIKRTYYAPMFLDDETRILSMGYGEDHIPNDAEWELQPGP